MQIVNEKIGATTVVRLSGSLDSSTSEDTAATLDALIEDGHAHLLVNLRDVVFVSSAGLRVLLIIAKRLTGPDKSLKISDLNQAVSEVFDISGFRSILSVFETEADALGQA